MAKKDRTHQRAESQTTMTISLPMTLLNEIDDLADADERSRSQWVVRELRKIVATKKAATQRGESEGRNAGGAARRSSTSTRLFSANEEPGGEYGSKRSSR